QAPDRRLRPHARLRHPDQDDRRRARPRDPPPDRPGALRHRPGGAQAGVAAARRQDRDAAGERDDREPDPRRGQHGRRPDRDGAVPVELGALDGARDGRPRGPPAPPRRAAATVRGRLRRPAAGRQQHDRRRPRAEPPRRHRRPPAALPGPEGKLVKRRLMIIVAVVVLVAGGGAYKFVFAAKGGTKSKDKITGTLVTLPTDFVVNLADGHYGKVTVALLLKKAPPASADGSPPVPTENAAVRAVITDELT